MHPFEDIKFVILDTSIEVHHHLPLLSQIMFNVMTQSKSDIFEQVLRGFYTWSVSNFGVSEFVELSLEVTTAGPERMAWRQIPSCQRIYRSIWALVIVNLTM
jgi:hypothetical protein